MNKLATVLALALALTLAMAAQAAPFDPGKPLPAELKPEQLQSQAAHLAADLLSRFHYQPMPLDDAMSVRIFNNYLKSLDPERLIFIQTDIDRLGSIRTRLDDAILNQDLKLPFVMFEFYVHRVSERIAYSRSLLPHGFDFTQRESYQSRRDKDVWAQSEDEVRDLWRKRVKNDWLSLKLAGNSDQEIVQILDRRYDNSLKRIGRLRSEDAFQEFMNAYTMAIEPHTRFMGPRAAEEFGISMKLSLVGIGTVLTEKDGYTTIREVVPGGPSALSGELMAGDRILGVGQGEGGALTDVQGWRMDDVVAQIRGVADSVVLLDVLPADAGPDGKHRRVSLIRKRVVLEERHARKSVLSVAVGSVIRRIGVISLPAFYGDMEARQKGDRNYKSAARDVARLLGELSKDRVDGVLIDLRNNGGGSLTEAIELTGLFVGKGPIVQQRDAHGEVTVERDARASLAWGGPLGVLINRGSASASEIFAAAIQDYGRGLVIGENSYGKGTVQAIFRLDQIAKNDRPKFGELKLTVAQFFRINGGTTQLRGVKPDIALPGTFDAERFGESSFDNPIPWVQIKAADFSPAGDLKALLPILLTRHQARVTTDREFKYLKQDIVESEFQRTRNLISLNEAERRMERNALEARLTDRKAQRDGGVSFKEDVVGPQPAQGKISVLLDDGLQADERNLANELAAESSRKSARDILLNEAVRILGDEVSLAKQSSGWRTVSSQARH